MSDDQGWNRFIYFVPLDKRRKKNHRVKCHSRCELIKALYQLLIAVAHAIKKQWKRQTERWNRPPNTHNERTEIVCVHACERACVLTLNIYAYSKIRTRLFRILSTSDLKNMCQLNMHDINTVRDISSHTNIDYQAYVIAGRINWGEEEREVNKARKIDWLE